MYMLFIMWAHCRKISILQHQSKQNPKQTKLAVLNLSQVYESGHSVDINVLKIVYHFVMNFETNLLLSIFS